MAHVELDGRVPSGPPQPPGVDVGDLAVVQHHAQPGPLVLGTVARAGVHQEAVQSRHRRREDPGPGVVATANVADDVVADEGLCPGLRGHWGAQGDVESHQGVGLGWRREGGGQIERERGKLQYGEIQRE